MSGTVPLTVLIEMSMEEDHDTWALPEAYIKALDPYVDLIPTAFYLPWPVELLPRPEEVLYFDGLPGPYDTVVVEKVEYRYSTPHGYRAYVEVRAGDTIQRPFDLHTLFCFVKEGWLVENEKKPIKEILEEAGLATKGE